MRTSPRWVLLSLLASWLAGAAEPAPASREVPPLQCWWRTDRAAVHVGQELQLTITCAAAQTAAANVVPDWDQLQPETIDLAPFEVVSGVRSDDVVDGSFRYTQFEYILRLTAEEFFGQDVPLPPLDIVYSIAVTAPGGSVQQGRERTYVLPPLPMKILSLVPGVASDIVEVPAPSFATIEYRRSQAAMAFVIGCGFLAAAALCLLVFLGSLLRKLRARREAASFRVPDWRIVAGCRVALGRVVAVARRDGWNEAHVNNALALLRVLGAVAIGKPVRQQPAPRDRSAQSGEWMLSRLSMRRPRVVLSAATTVAQLRAHASDRSASVVDFEVLDKLASAIAACSDVQYGRDEPDTDARSRIGPEVEEALEGSRSLLFRTLFALRWHRGRAGWRVPSAA